MTKRFGPVVAADAIDLDLHQGEVLALLGENGAGKTTLMNMLFGQYTPEAGSVHVWDEAGGETVLPAGQPQAAIDARIGMVHQHFTLAENLSVLDNILLGTDALLSLHRRTRAAREKLNELMKSSGLIVPLDARVSDLTVGERQRVEILKALYRDARILVLDEPTAVLTPQEADNMFASVRAMVDRGLSVIFISHKLHEVLAFSDRIAVLRHGQKIGEMATADANTGSIIRMMVGEDHIAPKRVQGAPKASILQLTDISASDVKARQDISAINLTVHAGEIVGIAGVSGNGQSAFAGLVSGLIQPTDGAMSVNGVKMRKPAPKAMLKAGVGRIPEDRHHDGIVSDMSVAENLIIERLDSDGVQKHGFLRKRAIAQNARDLTQKYDVRGPGVDARSALLSGGNIQKLILARVLETSPDLVLANQPTRGLDFKAASDVSQRLFEARDRGAGIILISEDLDEVLALADRILVMHNGHLTETDSRDRTVIGMLMAGGQAA